MSWKFWKTPPVTKIELQAKALANHDKVVAREAARQEAVLMEVQRILNQCRECASNGLVETHYPRPTYADDVASVLRRDHGLFVRESRYSILVRW
jgi:hypothetical protein